ncbi:uncharacterized protein LOC115069210 [Nannospalax galili]|uniref:uncharacterized protein LOC115069210 n=1 Tax=Nannospalax galili TaxID=1026970 RepID=UPI00111C5AA6|nr:uncharacterized protein LOC115069210 [Nannospalax galili]
MSQDCQEIQNKAVQGRFGINYSHQKDITAHFGGRTSTSLRVRLLERADCTLRGGEAGWVGDKGKEGSGLGLRGGGVVALGVGVAGPVVGGASSAEPRLQEAAAPRPDSRGLPSAEVTPGGGPLRAGVRLPGVNPRVLPTEAPVRPARRGVPRPRSPAAGGGARVSEASNVRKNTE